MAQERKASESASPASKGHPRSPIPAGKKDDLEDVSWALSTAEAMWGRGDHADALKWLRRAAESAAEAEADDRALELAKAAADVASLLSDRPTAIAPPPPVPVPASPPAPVITSPSKPAPPVARNAGATPSPPRVQTTASPLPRPGQQKGPTPPRLAQPAPISKRGGRKSSPSFTDEVAPTTRRASATNEMRKRARSRPASEESAPLAIAAAAKAAAAVQSLPDDDLEEDQHTRIGTPAYTESAQKASAPPPPMVPAAGKPPPAPVTPQPIVQVGQVGAPAGSPIGALMKTSQAVRVVVWRTPEGVRVAPAGTTVSAISVEALLVALDPGADLAAWLGNK